MAARRKSKLKGTPQLADIARKVHALVHLMPRDSRGDIAAPNGDTIEEALGELVEMLPLPPRKPARRAGPRSRTFAELNAGAPQPSKLYAFYPDTGVRSFVGNAYTLDAASEAVGEDDWPAGATAILVEPDGTELRSSDGGAWIKQITEPCSDCGAAPGEPHGSRCSYPTALPVHDENTGLPPPQHYVTLRAVERAYRAACVADAAGEGSLEIDEILDALSPLLDPIRRKEIEDEARSIADNPEAEGG